MDNQEQIGKSHFDIARKYGAATYLVLTSVQLNPKSSIMFIKDTTNLSTKTIGNSLRLLKELNLISEEQFKTGTSVHYKVYSLN